jgi:hypothetical protein
MDKIITLYQKRQIHLIALRSVIQFYLSLKFNEQSYAQFCEPTCALCFDDTCHMIGCAGQQLTRSMAANKLCNPEPLDPNSTLIVTDMEQNKEQVPQESFVFASASASDDVAFDDCASVTSISANSIVSIDSNASSITSASAFTAVSASWAHDASAETVDTTPLASASGRSGIVSIVCLVLSRLFPFVSSRRFKINNLISSALLQTQYKFRNRNRSRHQSSKSKS